MKVLPVELLVAIEKTSRGDVNISSRSGKRRLYHAWISVGTG